MKNLVLLLISITFAGVLGGCNRDKHSHEGEHDIKIEIEVPLTDGILTNPSNSEIHVHITSDSELHDYTIDLIREDIHESVAPFPITGHEHKKSLKFYEHVDFSSFADGTSFTLSVEVCENHECAEEHKKELTFKK